MRYVIITLSLVLSLPLAAYNGNCGLKIPAKWEEKLGEGTFGAIYPSTNQAGYVVKVAYSHGECDKFENENTLSTYAHSALADNPISIAKEFTVKVAKIADFKQSKKDRCCYYEMERIYPPFPEKCKGIVQLLFGNDFVNHEECNNMGYSLGPDKIANKLAEKYPNIKPLDLAKGIGALYALLQYAGHQDAFDVEFVFGLDSAQHPVIAALDYDKSNEVKELTDNNELVAQFTRALINSYFPRPEYKELFAVAEKAYLETAARFGHRTMAEKVIARLRKFT